MAGFTDLHSHFIYGLDDGAQTRADMEAMLDAAYADGITSLFATPHMTPGITPFDHTVYRAHLEEARQYCWQRGYPMTLLSGAELLYTPAITPYVRERSLTTLAGSDHVLLEFTPDIPYRELMGAVELLDRHGYTTILAHVERYGCLYQGSNMEHLRAGHRVACQMNANTILHRKGFWRRITIQRWLKDGMIDYVASDAHNISTRPFRMMRAYEALCPLVGMAEALRMTSQDTVGE